LPNLVYRGVERSLDAWFDRIHVGHKPLRTGGRWQDCPLAGRSYSKYGAKNPCAAWHCVTLRARHRGATAVRRHAGTEPCDRPRRSGEPEASQVPWARPRSHGAVHLDTSA